MTLAEKKAKALELREQGWIFREIAVEVGAPRSTVYQWISDPDGAKLKTRKDGYRGECEMCGGQTDGSRGRDRAPSICAACLSWQPEAIIGVIRDYADENGGIPPREADTRRGGSGYGRLPSGETVKALFGSWNDGLIAAGYVPHRDRRHSTNEAMAEMIREGVSTAEVADRFGCTVSNVRQRVRRTGTTIREIRQAA